MNKWKIRMRIEREQYRKKILELKLDENFAKIIQTTNHKSRKLGEQQSRRINKQKYNQSYHIQIAENQRNNIYNSRKRTK